MARGHASVPPSTLGLYKCKHECSSPTLFVFLVPVSFAACKGMFRGSCSLSLLLYAYSESLVILSSNLRNCPQLIDRTVITSTEQRHEASSKFEVSDSDTFGVLDTSAFEIGKRQG